MISDPKTTPNSRAGRVLFAALVAFGAWYVQFRLFRTNGLLWSLALWSAAVPLIDRLLSGRRYVWQGARAFARVPAGSEDPAATAGQPGVGPGSLDTRTADRAAQIVVGPGSSAVAEAMADRRSLGEGG